jgi:hypothetical protein
MGSAMRSATSAAKGMPAVSPPAMLSKASKPCGAHHLAGQEIHQVERMRGCEISLRQSI